MRRWFWGLGIPLVALIIVVSGCAGGNTSGTPLETATVPPVVRTHNEGIRAEGVVMPARSVTLQASAGGTIREVAVAEGDAVAAGDRLVYIDAADAEAAIQQAEAGLVAARAQLDQARAGTREEQIAIVAAQADAAEAMVAQAAAQRDSKTAGLDEADALDAQAQVLGAQLTHEDAQSAHEDTMTCYTWGGEEHCPALGTYEELTRFQEEAAYAGLLAASAQLQMTEARIDPRADAASADVQSALADRDAAMAQLALAEAGARAEEIAVAEAGVQEAESALAQARELLTRYRIAAPFQGTVTDLPVKPGDTVVQGTPVATLATLDRLQIKTTDLTELDIVDVVVGQPVRVFFDAMPDEQHQGTVVRIDPQGMPQFGDVLYTVTIELEAMPAWLRWGMTAQIEIEAVSR
ncbi:MAG: HlyD family secretion protein [Anaerolineae bacterium]